MGGLEPPSKQTIQKVSTCLSCVWLSEVKRPQAGYLHLIRFFLAAR